MRSLTSPLRMAGLPTINDLSGHDVEALTMANAPTTHPSPNTTSSITTAFMPTKQFFPIRAP